MMTNNFHEEFKEIQECISHIRGLAPATQLRQSIIMKAVKIAKGLGKDFPIKEADEFDLGNTGNANFADWAERKVKWLVEGLEPKQ